MEQTVQLFDPEMEYASLDGRRPHWMQDGTVCFITMRLGDSIPKSVLERWDLERLEYMRSIGIQCGDWRESRKLMNRTDRAKFDKRFHRVREDYLDSCRGSCELSTPGSAAIVAKALLHFDRERYLMGDFVIMPNHVHLLAVFPHAHLMRKCCYSWMKYTATAINQLHKRRGALWQSEPFDHLVRSQEQLAYLRDYIAANPQKARLDDNQYRYHSSGRQF